MRQALKFFAVSAVCLLGAIVIFIGKFLFDTIGTASSSKISASSHESHSSAQSFQPLNDVARTPSAIEPAPVKPMAAQVSPAILDDSQRQNEKNYSDFIRFLKFGPTKVSMADYERARREIALSPDFAVDQIVELINSSQPHDVEMRQGAFAALAQVIEDVKLNNPRALDSLVEKQIEVVRREVAKQELVPNDSFNNLSAAQKEELTRLRPFKLVNGKMCSMSLPALRCSVFFGNCGNSSRNG